MVDINNVINSEEEAHKYIESNAMDMRVSKKEIAQKIISLKQYD